MQGYIAVMQWNGGSNTHLCPMRKHFYTVEAMPVNEYPKEPGVVLVNKYADLR